MYLGAGERFPGSRHVFPDSMLAPAQKVAGVILRTRDEDWGPHKFSGRSFVVPGSADWWALSWSSFFSAGFTVVRTRAVRTWMDNVYADRHGERPHYPLSRKQVQRGVGATLRWPVDLTRRR